MKKFLTIFLALFIFLLSSCKKEEKQEEKVKEDTSKVIEEIKQGETDNRYSDVIGNLTLNSDEESKVRNLIKEGSTENLGSYLNELTLLKFTDSKRLSEIKKHSEVYSTKKDPNTAFDFQMCFSFKINGENIEPFDDLAKNMNDDDKQKVLKTWKSILALFPNEKLEGIELFMPFTTASGKASTGGFIATQDSKYVLGVNMGFGVDMLSYTVYHEFGHYISLGPSQIKSGVSKLGTYFKFSDVEFSSSSYMKSFYEKFWKNIENISDQTKERYLFYARHIDDFVSIYASTNFIEDFAESFARFIVGKDENRNGKIKLKMDFFKGYKELAELKAKIQNLCISNGIHPDYSKTP